MTKVEIDTPGVTIRIEADDPLDAVSARALALFHEAGGWPQHGVPTSVGFSTAERREDASYIEHGLTGQAPVRAGFAAPPTEFPARSPSRSPSTESEKS